MPNAVQPFDQAGGLPVPVTLLDSDAIEVVRNGVRYTLKVSDLKLNVGGTPGPEVVTLFKPS